MTTGAAGSSAAATITGTAPAQTLSLTIPKGDSGDLQPSSTTTWTGAIALSPTVPQTLRATMTGNVTLTLSNPVATTSFTVTLELLQDATGSRNLQQLA